MDTRKTSGRAGRDLPLPGVHVVASGPPSSPRRPQKTTQSSLFRATLNPAPICLAQIWYVDGCVGQEPRSCTPVPPSPLLCHHSGLGTRRHATPLLARIRRLSLPVRPAHRPTSSSSAGAVSRHSRWTEADLAKLLRLRIGPIIPAPNEHSVPSPRQAASPLPLWSAQEVPPRLAVPRGP